MEEKLSAAIAIIATSVIWLFILAFTNHYDVQAYREGYAEGKSGLPERWNGADYSLHQ